MRYMGITTLESDDTLRGEFMRVMGYPPEEVRRHWRTWTNSRYRFVTLGPVYPTKVIPCGEVMPGMLLLDNSLWRTVGIVDSGIALCEDDTLVTLAESVTVRS